MIFGSMLILAAPGVTAVIPSQFWGDWRVRLAECPPAITDRPVWLNATRIRMDHSVGDIRLTANRGRRDVTVVGEMLSDGDPRLAELRPELSESERELQITEGDRAVKLQRCPEEKTNK